MGDDGDNKILIDGDGDTTVLGNFGNDDLYGGDGSDNLYGGDGSDYLYGEDGNDILKGGAGNDILKGGAGDDSIYGGGGDDSIYSSDGKDTFVYEYDYGGHDTIVDFQTGTGVDANVISLSLSSLLWQYDQNNDDGNDTLIALDLDGAIGVSFDNISITLAGVTGVDLSTMIADGNIVLV